MTAGHCFKAPTTRKNDFACPDYKISWGYRSDKVPYLISTCVSVIAAETNRARDYAFFRVSPVPPVAVEPNLGAAPAVGSPITIFSHPHHDPLTWSNLCTLESTSAGGFGADQFSHKCDTEPASSGATVIDDATLTVVGSHNGGETSWNYGTLLAGTPVVELAGPR